MAGNDMRWLPLATRFPATLNSETGADQLKDGETPDAWNMDIDHPGILALGTLPTGTDRVIKTYTVSAATYTWYYQRLWRISTNTLLYGYPEYTAVYLPHDIPLAFNEDSQSLVTFFPFRGGDMFVAKSTGGYLIPNAIGRDGGFKHSDINPALGIAASTQAQELDGVAYISTANGLFMWDAQGVKEISLPFRTVFSRFASDTLKRDETKRRIIGTKCVYDPARDGFYDYSQTGFRFTTRAVNSKATNRAAESPFAVTKIGLFYGNTTEGDHSLKFQVKRDLDWEDEQEQQIVWSSDARKWVEITLNQAISARSFQMRITDLSAGLNINSINILTDMHTGTEQSWSQ